MPTDRVLIEIVTAANMAGIEQAKTGMLGMNAATLGLGLALGALVIIGKAAIDNTEKMDKAHRSLSQAADVSKGNFNQLQSAFDQWAETNKRYIPDQYAAEEALAAFIRTGVGAKTGMEELNVALDLSTLKGEDMASAQQSIIKALAGNSRGLKDLGITTEEYNAIWKNKGLSQAQKQIELLALMETKTKDGRKAQTDLSQSTNALNKDWQDITTKIGPPLLQLFTFIVGKVDDLVTWLNALGHNKDWNVALYAGLGQVQNALIDVVRGFEDIIGAVKWLIDNGGRVANFLSGSGSNTVPKGQGSFGHRAAGGPVSAGSSYLVGEHGPEIVTMGSSGYVTPNAGGTTINVHIYGSVLSGHDLDRFFNEGLRRARFAPGT